MVGRYWLPSSYYRKQSQLMGVFMEIKRPKMFVFSWHSAKSVVNVWLGSEVRSHDLGNTGIGGGAETGSCDISAIRSWQPTFNVRSKYPYGYWCGVCENSLIHIFWLVPGGSCLRAVSVTAERGGGMHSCYKRPCLALELGTAASNRAVGVPQSFIDTFSGVCNWKENGFPKESMVYVKIEDL